MRKGVFFRRAALPCSPRCCSACQPTPDGGRSSCSRVELNVLGQEAQPAPAGRCLADLLPLPERVDRPERTLGGAAASDVRRRRSAAPEARGRVRWSRCGRPPVHRGAAAGRWRSAFCPGAALYHQLGADAARSCSGSAPRCSSMADGSEDAQIKLKWLDETIPTAPLTGGAGSVRLGSEELPADTFLPWSARCAGRRPSRFLCVSTFGAHVRSSTFEMHVVMVRAS